MTFEEKMESMGFDWNIRSTDSGFRVELIDKRNGHKSVISKVNGIPSVNGARDILGLMAHKHRLTYKRH